MLTYYQHGTFYHTLAERPVEDVNQPYNTPVCLDELQNTAS